MPVMDGFELASLVRKMERNFTPWMLQQGGFIKVKVKEKPIRIVAVTAYRDHGVTKQLANEAAFD